VDFPSRVDECGTGGGFGALEAASQVEIDGGVHEIQLRQDALAVTAA
jgi:hypothetical protein